MHNFTTNLLCYDADLKEVVQLFSSDLPDECAIHFEKNTNCFRIIIDLKEYVFFAEDCYLPFVRQNSKMDLRECKLALYKALSAHCGKSYPWGGLTGIRPTKIAYELIEGGYEGQIAQVLTNTYLVSKSKAQLLQQIIDNQKGVILKDDKCVNLYIHIPFCTSKCNYCSFPSYVCDKVKDKIQHYTDKLKEEILLTNNMIERNGYHVASVYVGGGTPTAISVEQLKNVLGVIKHNHTEFTLEAGRPDTITDEKLDAALECGVNRISVNPQSFSDETLKLIGRNHSAEQIEQAYQKAVQRGFVVNMDLIAGLTGEGLKDFQYSLEKTLQLSPHNITVHTLSKKNGSLVKNQSIKTGDDVEDMVEYAITRLQQAQYKPYYLYRQKNMLENLENIGFCKDTYQCFNNITTMEESLSVVGCGLGAISKRVFSDEGRIERLANVRDLDLYFSQFEERQNKKELFFQNSLQDK